MSKKYKVIGEQHIIKFLLLLLLLLYITITYRDDGLRAGLELKIGERINLSAITVCPWYSLDAQLSPASDTWRKRARYAPSRTVPATRHPTTDVSLDSFTETIWTRVFIELRNVHLWRERCCS